MSEIKNECRGCRMYDKKISKCYIDMVPYITDEIQCPCMNCLIKGMCNDVCAAFIKHSSASFRHQDKEIVINNSISIPRNLMIGGKRDW